jgi:methyl-accepting chemotaxis protein
VAALVLTACSSQDPAIAPARDAAAATASSTLALDQYADGVTLPTVTITTLTDMLGAVADAESTVNELSARPAATNNALTAIRSASDAIAAALDSVTSGTSDVADDAAALEAASDDLDAAVRQLQP